LPVDPYLAGARCVSVAISTQPQEKCLDRGHNTVEVSSDEVLVSRIHGGDREALAELFKNYARPIRNIGVKILRDGMEADDLVQEVFLYLHRKSGLFDSSKGSARSWIFQVAYTQALLRRRYLKARGFYMTGIGGGEDRDRSYATASSVQTEAFFEQSSWQTVLRILNRDQREIFYLHFFEGYTFGEIAEKLGQSYANVRNHYYRGLEKLRQRLSENALNRR
jgi:RNA polymerase sigma-70 factor (ECF subfamily)